MVFCAHRLLDAVLIAIAKEAACCVQVTCTTVVWLAVHGTIGGVACNC
jgi:hypothetical protein